MAEEERKKAQKAPRTKKISEAAEKKAGEAADACEKLSIEERFARLDELLEEMEAEDCPLERSFQLYEEGMKLIAGAEAQVERVEKKLRILSGEEDAE